MGKGNLGQVRSGQTGSGGGSGNELDGLGWSEKGLGLKLRELGWNSWKRPKLIS